jgi:ABC-type multidrug transport system ATPase subunit/pSer/pThr/pTyr-binding forkhead associated (FHA) protein
MTTPILLIQIPGQPAREIRLEKDSYSIGRSPGNDIVIESPVISREHGRLTRSGAGWTYQDLGSRNGSFVEGKKLEQPVDMHVGSRLQLGKELARAVMVTFQLADSVPSAAPAPSHEEDSPRTMLMSNCPRCRVPVQPDAAFCPSCGLNLAPAAPGKTAPTISISARPELAVQELGGGKQSYPLTKSVMRVGRAADNDIVIASKLVSGHHLQVESQTGRVTVTDLNSTNGTMLNGVRIPPNQATPLHPGAVMRVGDLHGNSIQITYASAAGEGVRSQAVGSLDLTKLAKQASVLIGRAPDCDLSMSHPAVSKHHAMVFRQAGEIAIRDLGSTNGTYVNGARITQAALRGGDEIQIGPFRLVYDSQQQNLAGSRRLGHRLDGIRLMRTVKGGVAILNDVSVSIQSSEFVALVGGSGAGKSTLMKALNGYEPATKGQLLIDGQDLYSRIDLLRTEMGYVPQDDIIHRELPVRLALWYAAKLRLPDASEQEIQKTISDALKAVEMVEHQNKRVKDLSGGQRKRVSIACELLAQPTLFFLDEPTSGLDPGLEKKMMYDLKRLADQGRTIVLVTHATTNIEQCDYVAFMAKGRLAYYGPPREAITFFDAHDFADIYQKLGTEIDPDHGVQPPPELQADYQTYAAASKHRKVSAGVIWAEKFRKSALYQKYVLEKQASIHASRQPDVSMGSRRNAMFAPLMFIQQMYYLARRQMDLIRHDVRTLLILLAMLPMLGLLFGFVSVDYMLTGKGWENKGGTVFTMNINSEADIDKVLKDDLKGKAKDTTNSFTPFQDASTLVSMLALALTQAGTFAASYEIVKERPIFQRERAVNLSVWAYVLSKVLVLSLFAVFQVAGMLLLLSFFVDLEVTGVLFAEFSLMEIFISLYLAILASIALGLLISALVPTTDVVLYIILAQLFVQIVLTGALFPVDRNLLSYATPGYWATDSLSSIVDLPTLDQKGRSCVVIEAEIPDMTTGEVKKEIRYECSSAKSEQSNLAYYKHDAGHLMASWFAMGAQLVVFTILTIIIQARKKSGRD